MYGYGIYIYICVAVPPPDSASYRNDLFDTVLCYSQLLLLLLRFLSVGKERFSLSREILYNTRTELRGCRRQLLFFSSCKGPKGSQRAISQVIDVPIFFDRCSFQSRETKKIHPT